MRADRVPDAHLGNAVTAHGERHRLLGHAKTLENGLDQDFGSGRKTVLREGNLPEQLAAVGAE